jgi:hypothetical protein
VPGWDNAFEKKRREFPLELVLECEIEWERLAIFAMAENGLEFARIMVAVVEKEDDLTADLVAQLSGGAHFGIEKTLGKKPARLLAETDDRRGAHDWTTT